MSEIRRVINLAKLKFIPLLASFGFARHKSSNSFFREIGHLLHVVSFFGHRSGGSFRVTVDVWSPDFSDGEPPSRTDIASATWLGGQLSPWQVDSGNWAWHIDTDDEIVVGLREVEKLFITIALPWLDCLANDVSLLRAARVKGMASEVLKRIEKRCATNTTLPTNYPINANNWWSAGDDHEFLAAGGQTLVAQMKTLGFDYQAAPLMQFVRTQGVYVHVIRLDSVSAGIHAKVLIHVWTKWVAESAFGERQKPDEHYLAVNGGHLGTAGIDQGELTWFIAGPEAIRKTVPNLIQAIQAHALPWFSATSNRDAYYASISKDTLPVDRRTALLQVLAKHLPKDV